MDFSWAGGLMTALVPTDVAHFMIEGFSAAAPGWEGAHELFYASHADWVHTLSLGLIIAGFIITFFFYGLGPAQDRLQSKAPGAYHVLERHGWFDDIYNAFVAKVQQPFAQLLSFLDNAVIGGLIVRGSAALAGLIGMVSRSLHVGNIHAYVFWFLAGVVLFGAFALGLIK
ncbi:MAG: NADH-quinone oxidoreductase subunit L, partial [Verrucomicrobiota bacterium]